MIFIEIHNKQKKHPTKRYECILLMIIHSQNLSNHAMIHVTYIWANHNDLTVLPKPGIMVNKGNHPKMAELFTQIYGGFHRFPK